MVKHFPLTLPQYSRGFHLITAEILKNIPELPQNGILQVFIQHTSAGICINENADQTVLDDFEMIFNHLVPEKGLPYAHTVEGLDDMPAHIKSVFCGSSVNIPIINGRLALGEWQGIYLCEFRNRARNRKIIISIIS
ncbi:MAG: secondary thiamine-phosphate synthase enzyme YjbQ [Chitinophagales bacterium]|nr:secondary thiamine-phosphate synthase enzyme YjbQ [Chitinophagales bacterium]MCZ2392808.1 secondary thiamine-phosphate synthase enzyme YjbQ [Chitinophagales bacterium]